MRAVADPAPVPQAGKPSLWKPVAIYIASIPLVLYCECLLVNGCNMGSATDQTGQSLHSALGFGMSSRLHNFVRGNPA